MSHGESFVGPRSSPPRAPTPEIVGQSSLRNTTFHQTTERLLEFADIPNLSSSLLSWISTAAMISVILVVFLVQLALNLISSVGAQAVNDLVRTRRASLRTNPRN